MNFNKICTLFGFLLLNVTLFSQTASIDIVSFNSTSTYGPGSGVSVHINPIGIYDMGNPSTLGVDDIINNKFVLEMSDPSGDFSIPEVLSEVFTFYTPLINGLIPVSSAAGLGSGYKIRIKATLGWDNNSQTYNEVYSDEILLNIDSESISQDLSITSAASINSNFFSCDLDGTTSNQNGYHIPVFGSLNRASGASTGDTNVPADEVLDLFFEIESDINYNARLIDISNNGFNNQVLTITPLGPFGLITLPDDLGIGTYSVQMEQINSLGVSSIYSATFLWHSDNTNLGNTTTESVCLGSLVNFAIDITEQGISRNYPNSYYSFDFGDGAPVEYYTHAEMMFNK